MARRPKLTTYTVEFEWWIPRCIHQQIEAESQEAAIAEVKRMLAEDDGLAYDSSKDYDDACTDTQISGMWEAEDSYTGPDIRPVELVRENELELVEKLAPSLGALLKEALAFKAADFDSDAEVSGADLVEFFADWRRRVASFAA